MKMKPGRPDGLDAFVKRRIKGRYPADFFMYGQSTKRLWCHFQQIRNLLDGLIVWQGHVESDCHLLLENHFVIFFHLKSIFECDSSHFWLLHSSPENGMARTVALFTGRHAVTKAADRRMTHISRRSPEARPDSQMVY
jgi:hypothetical protein